MSRLETAEDPEVPEDVRLANAGHVGRRLVERIGGDGPAWEA